MKPYSVKDGIRSARNSTIFSRKLSRYLIVKTTTEKALEQYLKKSYAEQDQFKYYALQYEKIQKVIRPTYANIFT